MRVSSFRVLALGLLCVVLFVPSARAEDEAPGQKPHIFAYSETGHATLDPCFYGKLSPDPAHDERILIALLEPLTVIDPETLEVGPGTAESWSSTEDGRTWTFKLRANAVWQDGKPVVAQHFVESWRRTLDPYRNSPWSGLFRPLEGCSDISSNARMADALGDLRGKLKELIKQNQTGIPGEQLNAELDELGTRPFLLDVRSRAVKRMLKWDDEEVYSPEMAETAMKALKEVRREVKKGLEDALDNFGTESGGVYAKDDHTLIVKTEGSHPYLPELMARGAFCPMHPDFERHRDKLFNRRQYYMACGPYMLFGRGPKPVEELEKDVQSLVHLKANPKYTGPNKPKMGEIYCYTDQGRGEDVRMFKDDASQWVRMTWKEYPRKGNPKKPETNERKKIEEMKGFNVFPSSRVAYLRFRCDRPPFDEKEARTAFARSIDREFVAKQFWPAAEPINRLVPPGVRGRQDSLSVPALDNAAAQAAFKKSDVDEETWIEVSYADTPGHLEAVDALISIWKKNIDFQPGNRMEDKGKLLQTRRSGRYSVMLTEARGFANDPYAFLAGFHSRDPDGGLGWKDKTTDLLLEAARDPAKALSDKAGWLARVKISALNAPANGATSAAGMLKFRLACLAQAEQRLISEFVVVPLVVINEAEFHGGFSGITSEAGRRFPGFVGGLYSAKK